MNEFCVNENYEYLFEQNGEYGLFSLVFMNSKRTNTRKPLPSETFGILGMGFQNVAIVSYSPGNVAPLLLL